MQIDKAVQNVETTQEMHTQTAWFRRRNACIQYKPLEMDAAWQQSHVDSEAMTAFLGAIEPLYVRLCAHGGAHGGGVDGVPTLMLQRAGTRRRCSRMRRSTLCRTTSRR